MGTPGPREEWLDDRPASRIVPPPDPREEGRTRGRVAGGDMRNIGPAEKPAVLHQQSWDFQAGNLVFEIKSSRSLPASAFGQIGKVMSEIEKLKDMLTEKDLNSAGPSEDPAE